MRSKIAARNVGSSLCIRQQKDSNVWVLSVERRENALYVDEVFELLPPAFFVSNFDERKGAHYSEQRLFLILVVGAERITRASRPWSVCSLDRGSAARLVCGAGRRVPRACALALAPAPAVGRGLGRLHPGRTQAGLQGDVRPGGQPHLGRASLVH